MPDPDLVRHQGETCRVVKRLGGLVRIRPNLGKDRTVMERDCEPAEGVGVARPPDYRAPGEDGGEDERQPSLFGLPEG